MKTIKYLISFIIIFFVFRFSGFISCATTLDGNNFPADGGYSSITYYANAGYNRNWCTVRSDFSITDYSSPVYAFCYTTILGNGFTESWNICFYSLDPFSYDYIKTYRYGSSASSSQSGKPETSTFSSNVTRKYNNTDLYISNYGILSRGIGFDPNNSSDKVSYDTFETSYPISDMHNLNSLVQYIIDNGGIDVSMPVDPSSLGFLSDVKYYVDSAAYNYNPSNTPEYVSWGQYSTTGIDLSQSRYKVEFAIEDKTTWLRNNGGSTFEFLGNLSAAPISTVADTISHVLSLLPVDDELKMFYSGKAYNGGNYGKVSSLGLVNASARQYSLSVVSSYINILSSDTSNHGSKLYRQLNNFYNNPTSGFWNQVYKDWRDGSAYEMSNFSYNILARIVDTVSGSEGNWSCIDRHNVPYWMGDNLDVLNGGITYHTNYFPYSVKPNDGVFIVPTSNPDKKETEPIGVSPYSPDDMDGGDDNYYSNYYYNPLIFYRTGDQVVNDYNIVEKDGDFILIYNNRPSSNPSGDDGVGLGEALGLIATFSVLWTWYASLFGGLLPIWAVICIPVFSGLFIAVTLWKFGRNLIG